MPQGGVVAQMRVRAPNGLIAEDKHDRRMRRWHSERRSSQGHRAGSAWRSPGCWRGGHAVTMAARRPEKLEAAADGLRGRGLRGARRRRQCRARRSEIQQVVAAHRERYGRLDVLVNNAGVGIGAPVARSRPSSSTCSSTSTCARSSSSTASAWSMLRAAAAEHSQRASRQHLLDLRQARPGVAVRLLGHQARRRRLDGSDEQGAGAAGDQVVRAVPRVRGHADDRLRQGAGHARADDPPAGHRRGGALPAAGLPRLRRA